MIIRSHVIASGIVGGIWYYFFRSVPEALVCFFSGFLVDADHFIDYFANHPFTLSFKKIYKACRELEFKTLSLVFHSIELVVLIGACGILFDNKICIAVAVGLTNHLILDQIYNPVRPYSYFLIYRLLAGFKVESFVDEKKRIKFLNRALHK